MNFRSKALAKQTTIALWTTMRDIIGSSGCPSEPLSLFKWGQIQNLVQDEEYRELLREAAACPLCAYGRLNTPSHRCAKCPLVSCLIGSDWWAALTAYQENDSDSFVRAADRIISKVQEW